MPSREDPFRYAVVPMGLCVLFLLVINAYFSDHVGGSDELGLFNPTYMDVQYGKATYPIYGFYDSMPVHPPMHYKAIAMFMRAGLPLYYAQATPTVFWLLLCVWIIVRSRFPSPIKIGLLFGLCLTYAFFCKTGMELFGMRPEGELAAAWLAGLLLLETGRQDDWNRWKLFLGAVVLTYAASLHYYGTVAVFGAAVYAASAWWELGWPRATRAMVVIAAGCVLYGLAELVLWVIPQRADILFMIRSTGEHEGILAAIRDHLAQYHYWAAQGIGPGWLRLPFLLGLPVVLISTPVLMAMRSTRVLALAALPIQIFLLLFAWHKHAYYLIHEVGLYGAAVTAGLLTLISALERRPPGFVWKQVVGLALAGGLVYSLWDATRYRGGLRLTLEPRINEAEIARAASREILGRNAKVASRLTTWYASGAADLYDFTQTLLRPATLTSGEAREYLSRFDAVAEAGHMSNSTQNADHKALLSWYLSGDLRLRGFYFAGADSSLSYLLFQTHVTAPVRGFGLESSGLQSFTEDSNGTFELLTVTGPYEALTNILPCAVFRNVMLLPQTESGANEVLLTAILARSASSSCQEISPHCRLIGRIDLAAEMRSAKDLVAEERKLDRPIRFHQAGIPRPDDILGGAKDIVRVH